MTEKVERGGSFCGPVGATGVSSAGTSLTCTIKDGQTRARWRSTDGTRARRSSASGPARRKPTILEMNRRQLLAAAKAAGVELKRGEPDDAIRSKLSDVARGEQKPLVDARPIEPVAEPAEPAPIPVTEWKPEAGTDSAAVVDALVADRAANPSYGSPAWAARQAEKEMPPVDVTRRTARPPKLAWEDSQDGMFHTYSSSADALRALGPDTQIDMGDGVPLQDLLTDIAMDTGAKEIHPSEVPARYRAIAARLPEGSRPRRVVERLAAEVDGPSLEPMQLPDTVHPGVRELVRAVEALPAFRNPDFEQGYRAYQRVREIAERAAAGESRRQLRTDVYRLHNTVHEMNFDRGSQHFNRAVEAADDALQVRPARD